MSTRSPKRSQKTTHNLSVTQQSLYSGPIPDPNSLAQYEKINPGFANRLITMAEKEQDSRIFRIDKAQDADIESNKRSSNFDKRGQWFGLISSIIIVGLCGTFIFYGYYKEAKEVAVTVTVSLAGIFVIGKLIVKLRGNNH